MSDPLTNRDTQAGAEPTAEDRKPCGGFCCDGYIHLGERTDGGPTWCPKYTEACIAKGAS